jgi:hypothetical protein
MNASDRGASVQPVIERVGDIPDVTLLPRILADHGVTAVMHYAALVNFNATESCRGVDMPGCPELGRMEVLQTHWIVGIAHRTKFWVGR